MHPAWLSLLGAAAALSARAPEPLALRPLAAPPVLDVPCFSLATVDADGATNMNVLTYAAPVGIRPARKWCISLYRGTRTHANFAARGSGVLQWLREAHAPLLWTLGGESGRDVDKAARCAVRGFGWRAPAGEGEGAGAGAGAGGEPLLLPHCECYLRLTLDGALIDAGDHDIAICSVDAIHAPAADDAADASDGSFAALLTRPMYTGFARREGLITDAGRAVAPEDVGAPPEGVRETDIPPSDYHKQ